MGKYCAAANCKPLHIIKALVKMHVFSQNPGEKKNKTGILCSTEAKEFQLRTSNYAVRGDHLNLSLK